MQGNLIYNSATNSPFSLRTEGEQGVIQRSTHQHSDGRDSLDTVLPEWPV